VISVMTHTEAFFRFLDRNLLLLYLSNPQLSSRYLVKVRSRPKEHCYMYELSVYTPWSLEQLTTVQRVNSRCHCRRKSIRKCRAKGKFRVQGYGQDSLSRSNNE